MEMSSHDRHAILPPLPSPSRRLRARWSAFWFGAIAFWRRGIDGLARRASPRAPSLLPCFPSSEARTTELMVHLRSQQQLCLGATTAARKVHEVSQSRPTVGRLASGMLARGPAAARRVGYS
jgi:hypothetical protein